MSDITKSPLACRIHADVEPQRSVLAVLEGMLEWYNGFDFLWSSGSWQGEVEIPEQYISAFEMPKRMERLSAMYGWPISDEHDRAARYVSTACIMQAARWFTGYNQSSLPWDHIEVYHRTSRALAFALGYDVFDIDESKDWEGQIIAFNDRDGRTFNSIIDLIQTAIVCVKHKYGLQYTAADRPVVVYDEDDEMDHVLDMIDEEAMA